MLLETVELTLNIARRDLVVGLNWQVQAGECWCIIGRNGAGKTTLLRNLAGLNHTTGQSGHIFFHGTALRNTPLLQLARLRSFLPQGRNDAFACTVLDIVLGARHPYHDGNYWESADDLAAARAALQELDVADLADRDVRSLSGGERQRVAIAAVLAQDAQLMLLDEPTSFLDLAHQISVMRLLAAQCREKNKAVLMVSHDLNLAYSMASHALLLMDDGRWQCGAVDDIMTAQNLSQCLGHPLEMIWHGGQRLFLPVQGKHHAVASATPGTATI